MGQVWLKADGGIPIGMSLPLHETITEQWKNGALKRVTEDGERWQGDEFDLSGIDASPANPAAEGVGGQQSGEGPDDGDWSDPVRPADADPVKAWREYAAALGATTAEEAAAMAKADLIKLCTPPEADPLAEV